MNMKRLIAMVLALCLALCLCACGDQNDNKANDEATEATDANVTVTEAPTDTQEEDNQPAGIVYTVTVVDEGGNPVIGAMVQLCQGELCQMPVATDDNGVAVISVFEEGEYEAKLMTMPEGYDYTTEDHVFYFGSGYELTITLKAIA